MVTYVWEIILDQFALRPPFNQCVFLRSLKVSDRATTNQVGLFMDDKSFQRPTPPMARFKTWLKGKSGLRQREYTGDTLAGASGAHAQDPDDESISIDSAEGFNSDSGTKSSYHDQVSWKQKVTYTHLFIEAMNRNFLRTHCLVIYLQ